MIEPLMRVLNISKISGESLILNNVSFDINKGETVCIIGPSGAGKSSLLRCLNVLDEFQQGEIWISGQQIGYRRKKGYNLPLKKHQLQKQRQKIGFVFQHFNLFEHRTALENVMEGLIYAIGQPYKEARNKAIGALTAVGMEKYLHYYPSRLSGGQQQRIAIARSLVMEPDVILFDEPTSALDPESVSDILTLLQQLSVGGTTMLIVTHVMNFARQIADRILFMENGSIIAQGDSAAIFDEPENSRVKAFVRSMSDHQLDTEGVSISVNPVNTTEQEIP